MKKYILFVFLILTLGSNAQEGTKQFMPNSNDRLWLEFSVFPGNNFGMYDCDDNERIYIHLNAGEKMFFGMKMNTISYSGDVWTDYRYRSFRIVDASGTPVFDEHAMVSSGDVGYISDYTQAVTGPNGAIKNGAAISGGYTPLSYTATTSGNYYIEFESWWYTYGSGGNYSYRDRWALEYFDVTVTDALNNVITNPGEPNISAGRLFSKGWSFTTTSFDSYRVNAHFYVFTSDEFINKVNFQMYPYSFAFVVNSYGITTYTEDNYIKRTQSLEGDQTTDDDISEYRVFLNDPDRSVWANTKLAPPKVQVWTEDTLFMDYDYNRDPLYLPLDIGSVFMEKNEPLCPYEDVTIFKIETNNAGYTAIMIDVDKDGEYSTGGSDRVIYRDMRKGLNYVLWNFKTDAGAEVAVGEYNASATFLGRGPAHFPLYDVEQMDGIITSSIRPFIKLETTIYWDDTQITRWGDQDGGDLMDNTQQKQLVVDNEVPRTWSWHSDLANTSHNGNRNTLNTWFNALDLGYSNIGLNVQESVDKCVDGLAPWVGDIYLEGTKDTDIEFDSLDFTYKFFDPREYKMDSIRIVSLPANGTLELSSIAVTVNQKIYIDDLPNLTFTPITSTWYGRTDFLWEAKNGDRWSNNQENVYLTINTSPIIIGLDDQNLCTNTSTEIDTFKVRDDLADLNSMVITGFSADPSFVPNSGIVIGGTDSVRTVTVTPVANKSGKAIIYIMVDDGLSQSIEEFTVYVGPDLQFSGDTTVCFGQELYLIAQEIGADSYSWDFEGTPVSTTQSLQQSVGSVDVGAWSLTVEKDGCSSVRNFNVDISPLTTFSGDQDICVGEELTLTATEVNAVYSWVKIGTGEVSTSPTLVRSTDVVGSYTLYVNKDGCENTSDAFDVTVKNLPNFGLSVSGNTVDPGFDGTITISNAENGITYHVYQGATFIISGDGLGSNLDIDISETFLSIGDNEFNITADNGNCEVSLTNTATIHVNTPGITVSLISGNTSEDITTADFTVVLDTEPSADVTIPISSNNTDEGTIAITQLVFLTTNWSETQTVTVTGVDDDIIDGDQTFSIITDVATSGDIYYTGMDADDVDVTNEDNDIAGVIVNPTTGLVTSEDGFTTDNFNIRLTSQPASDVVINLSSSDSGEGNATVGSVTLNAINWDTGVTVTVQGADDDIDDDTQGYTILTSATFSSDGNFDGLPVDNVSVDNTDDDTRGVSLSTTSGLITTEAGGTASFTIVLDSEPTANVSIDISSGDPTEGSVSPTTITFTDADWDAAQTITVTGLNDVIDDGDILFNVITDAIISGDVNYDGLNPSNVSVTNTDDDDAGITISPVGTISTSEDGGSTTLDIHLNTEPISDITLSIISDITNEGTVSVATLVYDNTDWMNDKQVTITGIDDVIIDGTVSYNITVSVSIGDVPYAALTDIVLAAENADNDIAGVTLTTNTVGTTEAGGSGSVGFTLTSQPSANVVINLSNVDATEGTLDNATLTFIPSGWNVEQTVTFTGVEDAIQDGPITYSVLTTATSGDGNYNNVTVDDIDVTNSDNDIAGINVTQGSDLQTTEAGGTTSFTIELNTQPVADVTINISTTNINEGTVSPATLTFTNSVWGAQLVTITGVDDDVEDGDIPYSITTSNSSSADGNYNNINVDDVPVTNMDDDVAGITINYTGSLVTTEAGGTDSYTIVLDTKPANNVTITSLTGDATEGVVTIGGSLIFTPTNWYEAQAVTVQGQNDDVDDNDQNYDIDVSVGSTDLNYGNAQNTTVPFINQDNDTAGITVTELENPMETSEAGDIAQYSIVLDSEPTGNVVIGINSGIPSEGTVSTSSLTFDNSNWDSAVIITVTGVDDQVDDDDVAYTINNSLSSSADANYTLIDPADVNITNIDNDNAGVTITPSAPLETTEAGGTVTIDVVLQTRPTTNVTVAFVSDKTHEGIVDLSTITFTPGNWDQVRTVTVTGVDDVYDDGDSTYVINTSITVGDAKYLAVYPADVTLTNLDDDVAGVTVTAAANLETTEAGAWVEFTVVLDSRPIADVTINITSDDETEGTVSDASISFIPTEWNIAQIVRITGEDDDVDDGDIPFTVELDMVNGGDGNYNSINPDDVSVTNIDNDEVGFTVDPYNGLYTNEGGSTAQFNVRLNSEPTGNVTIDLLTDDITEGVTDSLSLKFTPSDWMNDQLVTITGQDDDEDDGDIAYGIVTTTRTSSDLLYSELVIFDVSATNQDDDTWGFSVNPEVLTIDEDGADETFSITLRSRPTDNVSIPISSENTSKATVLPASVSFTTVGSDWNTPKIVTVSPVDNDIDDFDANFNIVTGAATSSDANYSDKNPVDVDVTIINNDNADIIVSAISGNTSEDGTTAEFTIVLNSEPTNDVTIGISSSNEAEGTVSSGSVTFNSGDWDVPVIITVTGVQDEIADGNQTYYIQFATSTSLDGNYDGIDLIDVEVVNADDDSPGVIVFPLSGLITTEAGGTATFTVRLNSQPTDQVTIGLNSDDTDEGNISNGLLTFTTGDWDSEQTITVTGVDDTFNDGDILYSIITSNPSSADVGYDTITYVSDVFVTNNDDTSPRLADDVSTTDEDNSINIDVLSNDNGLDNGGLVITISSEPLNGTVNIEGDNTITYSPNGLFNGDDTFNYTVCDGENDCDEASVTVTVTGVNDMPIAIGDSRGTSLNTDVTIDVLFNDLGLEDGGIDVSIDEAPNALEGTAVDNLDNTITFTPAGGFIGTSTFIYRVTDFDGDSDTAYVTITIGEVNWVPDATNDNIETQVNIPVDVNVLSNDIGLNDGFGDLRIQRNPINGNVIVNTNRTLTYTPNVDYIGSDSLEYLIEDIHGDYDVATVFIVVNPLVNHFPVANDDSLATEYKTPVTIYILDNDLGLEDGGLSVLISPEPANGIYLVNPDSSVLYTPNDGFSGREEFGYQVCDINGDCSTAAVIIEVLENGTTNYIPVANNDNATTEVNTLVDINVLSNDTGLEDGFGSIEITQSALHGTLIVNPNRTITYTPSSWYVGSDVFEYRLSDVHGDNDVATVSITVTDEVNHTPVANDDSRATEYGILVSIDVLSNDEGLEDDPITITFVEPAEGITVVNGDNIDYTPAGGFSGIVSFTYTITDSDGDSDNATITIEVLEDGVTNYIPVANNDNATTEVNTVVDINVLSNDTGLEDGFGSIEITQSALHGTLTVNPNRTITYTPSSWYVGSDVFEYRLSDVHGDNDVATVSITVTDEVNHTPVANDDSRATEYGILVSIDVLSNDEGLEDDPITITFVEPAEGITVVNGDNIDYTPAGGFSGIVSFTYTITDSDGDSDNATITIEVLEDGVTNYIPVANNDNATTEVNTVVDINVLSNDTGLEDGFGSIEITQSALHGTLTVNPNRTITYTPSSWYVGSDVFEYRLSDVHGDNDVATVSITVSDEVNHTPVANDDSRATEYGILVSIDVLSNDEGLEDDPITITFVEPAEGITVVNGDNIDYTPAGGFSGIVSFTYTITDSDGDSDNATITIEVLEDGVTNYIPVANNDNATTEVNTVVDINVLSNDTGLEDGFGSIEITQSALHGTLTVNPNRTITYTPSSWYVGSDVFEYRLSDVHGDNDVATVSITVTDEVNHTPVANDDSRATEYGILVSIDVLSNDEGLEDDPITITFVAPAEGITVVNGDNIDYTPAGGFSGIVSFTYTITDSDGDSDNATITIEVLEDGVTNYIPVANNDNATTEVNTVVDINVLSNDTGLEDGFGSIEITQSALHGTLTVNPNRTITYTPSSWYVGSDVFEYRLSDVHGDNNVATVSITVTDEVNHTPVANDDSRATEYGILVSIDVLSNDDGLEDDPITITFIAPAEGITVVNGDNIDYTPASGFSGIVSFTYTITDSDGDSDNATITIEVLEDGVTNHIPVGNNDDVTTEVNTAVDINVLSNDTGLEDGFISIEITQPALHGTLTVNTNRTITYTPSSWYVGSDVFEYRLSDVHGDNDVATVSITVTDEVNHLPIANDDSRGTEYETDVTIDVLSNDDELEDGGIVVSIESDPSQGNTLINVGNTITYTPASGYFGTISFQYRVTDINGDWDVANVFVNVKKEGVVNIIPTAIDDDDETLENTSVDINVLANDYGLEDGFGQITIHESPKTGSVIINPNRTITYIPSSWFVGSDSFKYWVEDVDGDYDTAIVSISVYKEGNSIPEAFDDARGTKYQTPVIVDVLTNDLGLDDGGLLVTMESNPSLGSAIANGDNTITYTPEDGYSGIETFQYRIADSEGDFDTAYVQITVKEDGVTNNIPVALDDIIETVENEEIDIDILANDTGLEDGFGQIIIFNEPVNGVVVVNPNRTITYTPANSYIGADSLRYWIEDVDGDYDIATVRITVTPEPNYIPVANDDSRGGIVNNDVIVDVLINDTGLEDGGLIITESSPPSNGTIQVIGNNITYTPDLDYIGIDQFDYQLCDVDTDCDIATVTVNVKLTNEVPVAVDDNFETIMNTAIDMNVLANDSGLDDGGVKVELYNNPMFGTIVIQDNYILSYTPSSWFVGNDRFEYMVSDIDGDYSIATVNVTVNPIPNYIPEAIDDARGTSENTAVVVDVLTNDNGLEDGVKNLTISSNPSDGNVVVNGDNTITYTPDNGYIGSDSFEYEVCDNDDECSTARVTINVREENHVPVAIDDMVYTGLDTEITVDVLGNDTGLEDGGIVVTIDSDAINGFVVVNTDQTVTYTPESWFEGTDNFTYVVTDADGDFDIAEVTVIVMSGTLPGISVSAISGDTKEDGSTSQFTVVLETAPVADITIDLDSDDKTEGTVSVETLTFNASNWSEAQTVTITGQDDDVDDGNIKYKIVTQNIVSADPIYNGLSVSNIDVVNIDDDEAGILANIDSTTTSEDLLSTELTLVLSSEPLGDVTIDLSSSDETEGELSINQVVFTPENWNKTQIIEIIGLNDDEVDGDIKYSIVIAESESSDGNYNGIDLDDITIINKDNDSRELIIPDAFSPGSDGFNDYFEVVNLQHYDKASLRVYNRWGSLVFENDDYQNDWDGKSNLGSANGSDLPTGTYYFVMNISGISKEISGSVFIKR